MEGDSQQWRGTVSEGTVNKGGGTVDLPLQIRAFWVYHSTTFTRRGASMAKKVSLITSFAGVSRMHAETLEGLFGDRIEVQTHSYDSGPLCEKLVTDLVVVSTYPLYHNLKSLLPPGCRTVII